MTQMSEQQLSPTAVVKFLLLNGFSEFPFSDLHVEFKRHFPEQSTKTVYQSLYRVVERFVKKGYLVKETFPDQSTVFHQTDTLRELLTSSSENFEERSLDSLTAPLRDELAKAERELWVTSSAADQCQQKMQAYPTLRPLLSKMHMEYKEKSLSKLGEVEVLRRLLTECEAK